MNASGKTILAALLAGTLIAGASAAAKDAPAVEQASIPFVHLNSIRDWRADNRDGLWIQDSRRQWYYAKTLGPCIGLDYAWSIGFDTAPVGTLDRFSSIVVPREGRCALTSLTRSEAPPAKRRARAQVPVES